MIEIEQEQPEGDQLARLTVTTIDATGTERVYRATVDDKEGTTLSGKHLIGTRLVDGPETPQPTRPSKRVMSEIRSRFEDLGFEIYGNYGEP